MSPTEHLEPIHIRRTTVNDAAAIAKLMAEPEVLRNLMQLPYPAEARWKQILAEFDAPAMNGDHMEDLRRFVARRKQEGGAPTDF